MKWGLWSSSAASNNATPPDGWPEGQLPSTVNDCAREMMAAVKIGIKDLQFIDLGVTPTRTGNNTFTMTGDQTQWFGIGNRVKCFDSANTYYGSVYSSTFTTVTGVSLRMDNPTSQLLTASFSAVAVGYPAAFNPSIPDQAYRAKNLADNPDFTIWQRGPGPFSISSVGTTVCADRWQVEIVGTATVALNVTRSNSVPTIAQYGVLTDSSFQVSVSVGEAVLGANSYFNISQRVEGYDYRHFAQKPLTISFWANNDETGTYCVSLRNSNSDRSCVMNYQISAAATWEKKVISFPKPPIAGTWDYSAGIGLQVGFCFAAGATFQATNPGAWTSMNAIATGSISNFIRSAGNTLRISCVKINEGNQELPCEPRTHQFDLEKARRYAQPQANRAFGHAFGPSNTAVDYGLSPAMRQAPSISLLTALSNLIITTGSAANASVSSVAALLTTINRVSLFVNPVGAPLTTGQGTMFFASSGSNVVMFKCEL